MGLNYEEVAAPLAPDKGWGLP